MMFASFTMDKIPVRTSGPVGLKVTSIVQIALGARAAKPVQVLVAEKSPLAVISEILIPSEVAFVTVTVCGALVLPMLCLGKVIELGEIVNSGFRTVTGTGTENTCDWNVYVAVTWAVPGPIAVMFPVLSTTTTDGSDEA